MDTTGNNTNGNNLAALLKDMATFEGRKADNVPVADVVMHDIFGETAHDYDGSRRNWMNVLRNAIIQLMTEYPDGTREVWCEADYECELRETIRYALYDHANISRELMDWFGIDYETARELSFDLADKMVEKVFEPYIRKAAVHMTFYERRLHEVSAE